MINFDDVQRILRFKRDSLGQGGLLEFEMDSGNMSDIGGLGVLKRWLDRRRIAFTGVAKVFLVATANDVTQLPPELLRKGRMDEIFFVDLPDAATRADIFRIHHKRRKLDPARFDLAQLAVAADGFSGAEIEQAIVAAIYEALATKQPLATQHVLGEIAHTQPLLVVMAEKVAALRQWAAGRTVKAD